jgi:hypothetical protein
VAIEVGESGLVCGWGGVTPEHLLELSFIEGYLGSSLLPIIMSDPLGHRDVLSR